MGNHARGPGTARTKGLTVRIAEVALITVVVTVLAVAASSAVRMSGYLWGVQAPMPIGDRHELRRRVRVLWAKVGAHPRDWAGGDHGSG